MNKSDEIIETKVFESDQDKKKKHWSLIIIFIFFSSQSQAYNVALDLYDLVQWRDVLDFLKKRFNHFCEREAKGGLTRAEETFYSFFKGLLSICLVLIGTSLVVDEIDIII